MHPAFILTSALVLVRTCIAEVIESLEDLHSTDFDFIIVGGGTAGNVVANRLTENSNTKVLVLEAGGSPNGALNLTVPFYCTHGTLQTQFDWNYTTIAQPGLNNRSVTIPRGHVLGGSSSINFMAYTRGSFEDWDRYARITEDSGWSWNSMQKYFRRNEKWTLPVDHHNASGQFNPALHSLTGINSVSLAGFPLPVDERIFRAARQSQDKEFFFNLDYNSGRHLGVGHTQSTIKNGERSSSATSYLGSQFINRENLHVLLHAQVAKVVETRRSKGQPVLDTVEFTDGVGGPMRRVRARKEIILSAGSIGSPHILLNSGIGDKATLEGIGIGSILHLPSVGKNLSDHAAISNQWLVNATDSETLDVMVRNATSGNEQLEIWQKRRAGPLVDSTFNTVAWVRIPSDADVFKQFPGRDPSPGPNTAHIELLPTNGILRPPFPTIPGHFLAIGAALLQPTSRGSIDLGSSNPFDPPLINVNYLGTDLDVALLREGVKLARKFVTLSAFNGYIISSLNNATTDDEIDQFMRNGVTPIHHLLGTCSMSPKGAGYGVVDPDLRLKGAEGLRIVDASVLPLLPAAHTQVPVYVVAERASDMIKSHWGI